MSPIMVAARLQGDAKVTRKAWSTCGVVKVHLWELSTGEVIILRNVGGAFETPSELNQSFDELVNRFREKTQNRVFTPDIIH